MYVPTTYLCKGKPCASRPGHRAQQADHTPAHTQEPPVITLAHRPYAPRARRLAQKNEKNTKKQQQKTRKKTKLFASGASAGFGGRLQLRACTRVTVAVCAPYLPRTAMRAQ